ncbi:MAG TPA: hypothetical protein DCM54_13105, partial [Gammaproteobacteria bacterium]|nr:hypothetical protein [Gammaproteobacteria bacterium]
GNNSIIGLMVESNINAGNQSIPEDRSKIEYGVSVTDKCVDWATTEEMMHDLRDSVKEILPTRRALTTDDLMEQSA